MGYGVNWDELVEDLGPRLYRYFCARFSRDHADDLTQESLLRLFRKVQEGYFNPKKGSLPMLAFGIARLVALEIKAEPRSLDMESASQVPDISDNAAQSLERNSELQKLRALILKLSYIEQEVLAIYLDQELSMKEIALILNLPEGTIKSHLSRAKQKLKTLYME